MIEFNGIYQLCPRFRNGSVSSGLAWPSSFAPPSMRGTYAVDDIAHALDVAADVDGNVAIARIINASLLVNTFAHDTATI